MAGAGRRHLGQNRLAHATDPVARAEPAALGGRADDASQFEAGDERGLGPDLVEAPGLEQIGKGDAGSLDVDDDRVPIVDRLGRVDHGDPVWPGQFVDLERTHGHRR